MKKHRSANIGKEFYKELLKEFLAMLCLLALFFIFYALGMGLFRLIFGAELANELLQESESAVIIGIVLLALGSMLSGGVIYCTRKIIRFFKRKSKDTTKETTP